MPTRRSSRLLVATALAATASVVAPIVHASAPPTDPGPTGTSPADTSNAGSAAAASGPEAAGPLRVAGRNWIELSPVYLAAESFATEPVTVVGGGVADLATDDADVATNAETQLLQESIENPDLRVILTVSESAYRIVARRSAGIESLADLEGKRIMVPPGTSAQYFVVAMLATVGLTEDDVEFVPLPDGTAYLSGMDQMSTALARGDADAISIFEPEPVHAIERLGDDAVVFQDPAVYRELFNLHANADALADPARRTQIVSFVRAVIEASEALTSEPDEHWLFLSNTNGFTVAEIEAAWPEVTFPGRVVDDLLDVLEVEEEWVARQDGREPRTRDELATLIDTSVVDEALAAG